MIDEYVEQNRFTLLPIQKQMIKHVDKLEYTYKNVAVSCEIVHYDESRTYAKKVNKLSHFINKTIDFLHSKSAIHQTKLNILIALNNVKKEFPKSDKLEKQHVNNGLTTLYHNGNQSIYIYRIQDVYKVLIHEMIHYFDYDFRREGPLLVKFKPFNIIETTNSGQINYNESYVETLAVYLYAMFTGQSIQYYRNRGIRVAKALINHVKKYPTVYQNTNAYSYYIVRAALMIHIDKVLKIKTQQDLVNVIEISMKSLVAEIKKDAYEPLKTMQVVVNSTNRNTIDATT